MSQSGVLTVKSGGGAVTETLTGNTGGPVGPDGSFNINILGNNTSGMNVVGNPGTNTLSIVVMQATTTQQGAVTLATNAQAIAGTDTANALTSDDLKAKLGTQTAHSLALFQGTSSALTPLGAATNGQIPIGSTGVDPVLATLSAGTGVTITNGAGSITIAAGASVPLTFDGDSGSATPSANTITFNANTNAGKTVLFTGSGATLSLSVSDGTVNTLIGSGAGAALSGGAANTSLGSSSLNALTSGNDNVAIGYQALLGITTGSFNIAIGETAGVNYSTSDSSNIAIGAAGTAAESHTIRIGQNGSGSAQQNRCFIAGIDGVNVGSVAKVVTQASNQLGTATITAGTGITITPTANTITIAASGLTTLTYTSVNHAASPYTVTATDDYLGVDVSGGVVSILLPNAPSTGRVFYIKDKTANAATSNISVTTVGGVVTIDGGTTYTMNVNYQSIGLMFNGTSYEVF